MKRGSGERGDGSVFGFGGRYVTVMSELFDVLAAGLLWLLCSLPVVTCGAASAALYRTVVRSVKEGNGYAARGFFRSFKENFRPSLLPWCGFLAAMALAGFNLSLVVQIGEGDGALFLAMLYGMALLVLIPASLYYCAVLSRFAMPAAFHLRLAFYMVFRYLPTTLLLCVISLMAAALVCRFPFLLFFLPGPYAFLISEFTERLLERHMVSDGMGKSEK